MKKESKMALETIFKIIENQMRDNTPPITKETFRRLKTEGYSKDESMRLIGYALAIELSEVMKSNEMFNEERYTRNLKALPELSWDDE